MIDWNKVKRHRAGEYAHLSEEELIGSGRTTTMLLDMFDYIDKMIAISVEGDASKLAVGDKTLLLSDICPVILVMNRGLIPNFKLSIRELAPQAGMYVTQEKGDMIWVNDVPILIVSVRSVGWYGRSEVFVDHGALFLKPDFMETSGLRERYCSTLRNRLARDEES